MHGTPLREAEGPWHCAPVGSRAVELWGDGTVGPWDCMTVALWGCGAAGLLGLRGCGAVAMALFYGRDTVGLWG